MSSHYNLQMPFFSYILFDTHAQGLMPPPSLRVIVQTAPFLPPFHHRFSSQHNWVWVNLLSQEVQANTDSNLEIWGYTHKDILGLLLPTISSYQGRKYNYNTHL